MRVREIEKKTENVKNRDKEKDLDSKDRENEERNIGRVKQRHMYMYANLDKLEKSLNDRELF